jgi:hypothetical protein
MKLRLVVGLGSALVLALALGGCFATNPLEPPAWTAPPGPPPSVQGALVDDMAVDPTTGNILTLSWDDSGGYGQVVGVLDSNFNELSATRLDPSVYASSVAPSGEGFALVSDGGSGNWRVDLDTGVATAVTGMGELASGPMAFFAAGDADGDAGSETVGMPCEFGAGDDMDVFDGEGNDRVLLARVPLDDSGLSGVSDTSVGAGIVWALGYEGPVGLDAMSGARVYEFTDSQSELFWNASTWAFDPVNNRLIVANYNGGFTVREL